LIVEMMKFRRTPSEGYALWG